MGMPSTQAEAFAAIEAATGGICYVDTDGPAVVYQVAMLRYPDGSEEPVADYIARTGIFA